MKPDEEKTETPGEPEEESFGEMLDRSFVAPTRYEPGRKVSARVVKVTPEWVFLDLGRKGEGVLAAKELQDEAGTVAAKEGDTLEAYFVSSDGSEMLFTTRVAGGSAGSALLEDASNSGIPVDGVVVKEIKGGYEVRLAGGARAFCPHSQMDLPRSGGQEERVGKHAAFRITKYGEKGRNIVVSRRVLLEEEEERKTREVMATLTEGMVMTGTVTAVREFGAFVSVGPIEGLLPISEIGYDRVEDIQSVLSVGQEVEVAITRLDWANKRFSFSLKKTLADPWETAVDRFPAGSLHVGKVARLTAFGAFVSLGGGSRRPAPYIETRRGKADPERGRGPPRGAGDRSEGGLGRPREASRRALPSGDGEPGDAGRGSGRLLEVHGAGAPSPRARLPGGSPQGETRAENEITGAASDRGAPSDAGVRCFRATG